MIFDLASAAECTQVTSILADGYGNVCKYALAAELAKLQAGLTADDIDITSMACATAKATVEFTVFVKSGFSIAETAVKTNLEAVTAANLGTAVKAAYTAVTTSTGMTAVTVTDPTAKVVFGAAVQVAGQAAKITQTYTLTFANAQQAECTASLADTAAGRKGFATAISTLVTKVLAADITYPVAPTCPTATPPVATFPIVVLGKRTAENGRKAALDAITVGATAAAAGGLWKQAKDDMSAITVDLGAAPTKAAAVETLQTAAKTVSGTVDLTVTDYADCNKLKGELATTQIKEYIKTKTGALMGNIVATVTCAGTTASLYIMVTSPVLLGNTLSAEVKTTLGAIATWGADIKTEVDLIKDVTVTKCERTTVATFTEADPVTAQAKDATVSGTVLYTVSNRADCEDVKSKQAALLTTLVAKVSATADNSNSVMISCKDTATTMTYKLKVAKTASTTDQMIMNTLNGMDDAAWKKIVTDALATATAVTLEGAYSTTTITAPTSVELTTTTTVLNTATTTAAPYVAMSKVMGKYTVKGTESECLNMKDQKAAIASLIKTKSTVNTAGTVTVELACAKDTGATTWTATIDYTIMWPTANTPTGAAIVTALKAVADAKWITDVQAAVGAVTGVPAPTTLASWTSATAPVASVVTTTPGPTTTFTGSTTLGTQKEISGSLAVTVGSMAECNKMADANGVAALKEMLKTETGGIATTNMVVTVTCARRRRLSDGRRLATATATVNYKITVPANSAVTASAASTSLKNIDNATWATKVTSALAKAATPVTLTNVSVVKTDPTTTTIHNVSSALMWLASPLAGVLVMLQFLW